MTSLRPTIAAALESRPVALVSLRYLLHVRVCHTKLFGVKRKTRERARFGLGEKISQKVCRDSLNAGVQ